MLKIEHFSKTYGKSDKKAVDDLTLELNCGEIFGFLGPNGAGKSTTRKTVCGILNFEEGNIYIDGVNLKTNPVEAKAISKIESPS